MIVNAGQHDHHSELICVVEPVQCRPYGLGAMVCPYSRRLALG